MLNLIATSLLLSTIPSDPGAVLEEPQAPETIMEWLASGEAYASLRYRFEFVDQDGITKESYASTLRTVIGYKTPEYEGFRALIEMEDVTVIGDESYKSPTNSEARPLVADPDGTEVNQVYLDYGGVEDTNLRLGTQRIIFDNARFIGNVGWRQNEQTYDAFTVTNSSVENLDLQYSFLHNVNRVTGEDHVRGDDNMKSHLLHAAYDVEDAGKLSVYYYHLNYDDQDALSTGTLGARWNGDFDLGKERELTYGLEFAQQTDQSGNDNDVDASYYRVSVGAQQSGITARIGYEVLEGTGVAGEAFQTPLATGHAHNGWADKFLTTPADGLEDLFLVLSGSIDVNKLAVIFHDFSAQDGSDDYGTEIDLSFTRPLMDNVTLGVKAAFYDSDDFATDTTKLWTWLSVSL